MQGHESLTRDFYMGRLETSRIRNLKHEQMWFTLKSHKSQFAT